MASHKAFIQPNVLAYARNLVILAYAEVKDLITKSGAETAFRRPNIKRIQKFQNPAFSLEVCYRPFKFEPPPTLGST